MELKLFTDPYSLETIVCKNLREFVVATGYALPSELKVSPTLQTDPMPKVMVWVRIVGPSVETIEGYQYTQVSISVSCGGENGESQSSSLANVIRAYMLSEAFTVGPIIYSETASGVYPVAELDGFERTSYTFTAQIYELAEEINL